MKSFIKKYLIPFFALIGVILIPVVIYLLVKCKTDSIALESFNSIEFPSAAQRIASYHRNVNNKILTPCSGSQNRKLSSFSIDTDQLLTMVLTQDANGNYIKRYDDILVFPAMHEKAVENENRPILNFIFAGVKSNGKIDNNNLYDYCDPCPKKCPFGLKLKDFADTISDVSQINISFDENCN